MGRRSGWEVVGPALVGGGCEPVRFGHGFGDSSQVGGGLSMVHFAIRVDRAPNNAKEVSESVWP